MSDPTTSVTDPRDQYPADGLDGTPHSQPGLTSETTPTPDHGESTYRGSGRLEGRRALITGGDSGIGRAVAIAFAREGADVAIVHMPEESEDAASTAELVRAAGRTAVLIAGDVRTEEFCRDAVERTAAELGGLDILVSNAAYQKSRANGLEALETDEIERTFRTNLFALLWFGKHALAHLEAGSSIIVTTSIQAFQPSADLLDYAMTKAAQVAFVEAMAQKLGPRGIRVNGVAPGPIWTPLIPATGWPEKVETFGQDTPLGRPGQPAELAPAYVLLASELSSYMSGTIVGVTGGRPF